MARRIVVIYKTGFRVHHHIMTGELDFTWLKHHIETHGGFVDNAVNDIKRLCFHLVLEAPSPPHDLVLCIAANSGKLIYDYEHSTVATKSANRHKVVHSKMAGATPLSIPGDHDASGYRVSQY